MRDNLFNPIGNARISIPKESQKRFFLLACEVMAREFMLAASRSKNVIDLEFVTQGWHDIESKEMSAKIQQKIDRISSDKYDAILLGFGLCNNGTTGIRANQIPIVIPRAHDCIGILLGSHEKYIEQFQDNPGTYYLSSGWLERDNENIEKINDTIMAKLGLDLSYNQYIEKYGQENADFIISQISGYSKSYKKLVLIENGTGHTPLYKKFAKQKAKELNLEFQEIKTDLTFFEKMLNAEWDENNFVIVHPGEELTADLERIMKTKKYGDNSKC